MKIKPEMKKKILIGFGIVVAALAIYQISAIWGQ